MSRRICRILSVTLFKKTLQSRRFSNGRVNERDSSMKVFALFLSMLGFTVSAPAQEAPKIHLERFVRGFENPLYLTHDGTDRLFVVEQPGRIKIVKDGQILPKPFLDIRKQVDFGGEKG